MRLPRRRTRPKPGQHSAAPPAKRRKIDRFEVAEVLGAISAAVCAFEALGAWAAWGVVAVALLAYGALEGPGEPPRPSEGMRHS